MPLAQLRAEPRRAAILTDVDGTLAPIVERPEQAAVPAPASALLAELSRQYALVGCISGRRAEEARRLVGVEEIAYAGNHGLELLLPGDKRPRLNPTIEGREREAEGFLASRRGELDRAELRVEDKGPIQALHWRGAEDEAAAEARAREIAAAAKRAGLHTHWGRKVLELRPFDRIGKDTAVRALLSPTRLQLTVHNTVNCRRVVYAGDDRTDLDAFRGVREMREEGALEVAICVGVLSAEGPPEIAAEADLRVEGPAGWIALLESLAG